MIVELTTKEKILNKLLVVTHITRSPWKNALFFWLLIIFYHILYNLNI